MPLSRLLLPLCGLLLALVVTAATAAAPLYQNGEVTIEVLDSPGLITRDWQSIYCQHVGGALLPIVTEKVFALLNLELRRTRTWTFVAFIGGSSMLSPPNCTKHKPSLDCIWYWDQGRYHGINNALAFYRGNLEPRALNGAGMIGYNVGNRWCAYPRGPRCPDWKKERYATMYRNGTLSPVWTDSESTRYSYADRGPRLFPYSICGVEGRTAEITVDQPSEQENRGVNMPLVIGLSVAVAIALIIILAIIIAVMYCGGCSCGGGCTCGSEAQAAPAAMREEGVSQADSVELRLSGMDDGSGRLFHDDGLGKKGNTSDTSTEGSEVDVKA